MENKVFDLEDRLVDFAAMVVDMIDEIPNTKSGNHIAGQLLRSGTSPAPNCGEAQAAESRKDFIHKMKVSLKELRESLVWLKILRKAKILPEERLVDVFTECDELVAIFVKSVETAKANQ